MDLTSFSVFGVIRTEHVAQVAQNRPQTLSSYRNKLAGGLKGFENGSLLTAEEAMDCFLELLYRGRRLSRKTWDKRERNAEIYRRYLAGEDSVRLARAFEMSDRRVRSIIGHERRRRGH